MKGGRRAAARLLVVPVALGSLWMPVGGHGPGTRTNSSSHHQHKSAGHRSLQHKVYLSLMCVCFCTLFLCECVEESGREIIPTERCMKDRKFLWKDMRMRRPQGEDLPLTIMKGNKITF